MPTGIAEKKQPEARRSKSSSDTVDKWRWIFKDLKQKGYVSLFSEDNSRLGSFNFHLHNRSTNTPVDDTLYQLQFVTSLNEGFYEASVKMKRG